MSFTATFRRALQEADEAHERYILRRNEYEEVIGEAAQAAKSVDALVQAQIELERIKRTNGLAIEVWDKRCQWQGKRARVEGMLEALDALYGEVA